MSNLLVEKWSPILESEKIPTIMDSYKKKVTAQLLENQQKYMAGNFLNEAAQTVAANVQNWDAVMINLVRRMTPRLIPFDICGVQTMQGPSNLIFAMRSKYTNAAGAEALVDEANTNHSGAAVPAHVGDDPWDATFTTGTGKDLATGESDVWNSMSMTIEKFTVVAKTRQLRADYSIELAQDLKTIHGADAETELSNILSGEIIAEINREVVRTLYAAAKVGAQFATAPGVFDLAADGDGRWFLERVKGLIFAVERDANQIAKETRRGKGNFIITSADVASALVMAGILNYAPALQGQTELNVDESGVALAGRFGSFKVYVDPYLGTDGYVVGYKGAQTYDAGMFYCPYIPLQMVHATSVDTFQPAIGFKTRYGLVANPYTTLAAGGNVYYRKAKVLNLL